MAIVNMIWKKRVLENESDRHKPNDHAQHSVHLIRNRLNGFQTKVSVRQGCLLSLTLFNIFLEFVRKELKSLDPTLKTDILC